MIDKNWAQNQLRHARNSLLYTLAGMQLLNSDASLSLRNGVIVLKRNGVVFNPDPADRTGKRFEFEMNQLVHDYTEKKSDFNVSLDELYKFVRRNLIKESFEVVKAYAGEAKIKPLLESESWFWFAYVVRNSVSHDLHFRFRDGARKRLPLSWRGIEINLNHEGSEITGDVLNPQTTLELIIEMQQFVSRN